MKKPLPVARRLELDAFCGSFAVFPFLRKPTANELIERVTGGPLSVTPYVNYLKQKYGELYNLS